MPVTRFAPSPTGYLHLGHAYSALFASRAAQGGAFLLRIEDIDPVRSKPEFIHAIYEDLQWLGLDWPKPVRLQSEHLAEYQTALDKLKGMSIIYPCFCTRKQIAMEADSIAAPHASDGTVLYPGTCKSLSELERAERLAAGGPVSWRLDVSAAMQQTGPLSWTDRERGRMVVTPQLLGDVVLARKDIPTSYHLSVVVDDHLQGVSLVTRGEDLLPSTHIHVLLQSLLGFPVPSYHHHKLLTDSEGRRFAKRDKSRTLRQLREQGISSEQIISNLFESQSD